MGVVKSQIQFFFKLISSNIDKQCRNMVLFGDKYEVKMERKIEE